MNASKCLDRRLPPIGGAISCDEILAALEQVSNIERPPGDNEHLAVNSDEIYDELSKTDQETVDYAVKLIEGFVYDGGDDVPSKPQIGVLRRAGLDLSYGPDQENPMIFTGSVTAGDWRLKLGDSTQPESDD